MNKEEMLELYESMPKCGELEYIVKHQTENSWLNKNSSKKMDKVVWSQI